MLSFMCGAVCAFMLLLVFDWVRSHLRAKQEMLTTIVTLAQGTVLGWGSLSVMILLYREFAAEKVDEKRRRLKPLKPINRQSQRLHTLKKNAKTPFDLLRSLVQHPDGAVDRSQCVQSMQTLFSEVSKMLKTK